MLALGGRENSGVEVIEGIGIERRSSGQEGSMLFGDRRTHQCFFGDCSMSLVEG